MKKSLAYVGPWQLVTLVLLACTVTVLFETTDEPVVNTETAESRSLPKGSSANAWQHAEAEIDPAKLSTDLPIDNTAPQVAALVQRSHISHEWLVQHAFAADRVAMARLTRLLDGSVDAGASNGYVLTMASGPNAMQSPELETARISEGERYVQTTLPTSKLAGLDSVVMRWRNLGDESVQELSSQSVPTDPTATSLPLWMYRPQGWPVGQYAVEVYSGDVNLRPIASGKYAIVANGGAVTPQSYLIAEP